MPRREHKLGPADYAILGLLAVGPRHGYQLAPYFAPAGELGLVCTLGLPQLYARLHSLEQLGHVRGEGALASAGPPRQVFHLTDAGVAILDDWLRRPVRRIRYVRQDFLLKLFFVRRLPDCDPLTLVERQLSTCRALLQDLHEARSRAADGSFAAIVYDSRQRVAEATLAWLEDYETNLRGAPERAIQGNYSRID